MGTLFRRLIKLLLIAFAASMVLAMLLVGICAALLTLLWSLLTGRKPAAFSAFARFRDASRQFQQGAWTAPGAPGPGRSAPGGNSADIVDVQAHEVRGALNDKP